MFNGRTAMKGDKVPYTFPPFWTWIKSRPCENHSNYYTYETFAIVINLNVINTIKNFAVWVYSLNFKWVKVCDYDNIVRTVSLKFFSKDELWYEKVIAYMWKKTRYGLGFFLYLVDIYMSNWLINESSG